MSEAAPSASISAARRSPTAAASLGEPVADRRMDGVPVVSVTTARSQSSSASSPQAISAKAPTGALQPASSVASRLRSAVTAARVSGSGTLDTDVMVFVPADDRQVFNTWPTPMTGYAVVDGVDEMAYEQSTDLAGTGPGPIGDALGVPAIGAFPMLSPAVVNRMFVLPNVGTTGPQDTLTDTVDVNVDYWPRFLYVRPPS